MAQLFLSIRNKERSVEGKRNREIETIHDGMIFVASPCSIQGNDFKIRGGYPFDWLSPLHARVAWAAINKKVEIASAIASGWIASKGFRKAVEWEEANDCGFDRRIYHQYVSNDVDVERNGARGSLWDGEY